MELYTRPQQPGREIGEEVPLRWDYSQQLLLQNIWHNIMHGDPASPHTNKQEHMHIYTYLHT